MFVPPISDNVIMIRAWQPYYNDQLRFSITDKSVYFEFLSLNHSITHSHYPVQWLDNHSSQKWSTVVVGTNLKS